MSECAFVSEKEREKRVREQETCVLFFVSMCVMRSSIVFLDVLFEYLLKRIQVQAARSLKAYSN